MRALVIAAMMALSTAFAQVPVPEPLKDAKTVFLHNGEGLEMKYLDRMAEELKKWKRFELVGDMSKADAVFALGVGRGQDYAFPLFGGVIAGEVGSLIFLVFTPDGKKVYSDKEQIGMTTAAAATLVNRLKKRFDPKK